MTPPDLTPEQDDYFTLPAAGRWPERDVQLETDGFVTVEWYERSDDYCGYVTRRLHLSSDEFDLIAAKRAALLEAR